MTSAMMKFVSRMLIASMLLLSFQANAGMIGADEALASDVSVERTRILTTIDRPEVAAQLQSMGLDAANAKERVAAMTDEEVRTLSNKIDSMPAGARVAPWNWVVIIGIAAWIYYMYVAKN